MIMDTALIVEKINKSLPGLIEDQIWFRDELQIYVKKELFISFMKHLRYNEDFKFDLLLDVAGIDRFSIKPRFELVYILYSLEYNIAFNC